MTERMLIINADDLGYDPAVTKGILESIRNGVVSSATLIVNSPHSRDGANRAEGVAVGLHLNLARFAPVWTGFPGSLLEHGELSEALAARLPPEVVENETLAQLDLLESLMQRKATHVDVHKHLHAIPSVLEGLAAAAKKRSLPVRALDDSMRRMLRSRGVATPDHFVGDAGAEAYWTLARLRSTLERLPPGTTELMCHPGHAPVLIRSGYSAQREVELETFIHPSARSLLERFQVTVGDFSALRGLD